MDENKIKALDSVLVQIEKQYGKGAIMKLGSKKKKNIDNDNKLLSAQPH